MSASDHSQPKHPDPVPRIQTITMEAPWEWMAAGWQDLSKTPMISLGYGLAFAGIAALMSFALMAFDLTSLVLTFGAGFILLGPVLAVGLYEVSRRLQAGEPIAIRDVLIVKTRAPTQLMFLGMMLMIAFLAWIRIATLLFALFYGLQGFPPLTVFLSELLFTVRGLALVTVGTAIGGVLALLVFSISAISVPLLMVRNVDAVTAMLLSIRAVRENLVPMVLWAWLIALMIGFGFATLFFGLIVTFPLIGHGTWHCFRAVVDLSDTSD